MTKTITGIVVVVAIAVAAYFIFFRGSTSSGIYQSQTSTERGAMTQGEMGEQPTSGKKMAFSEFIKQDGSYKCTVSQDVGGANTMGTTYVSNGMVRGEYNVSSQGMNMNTFFILRDGYSYTWNSVMTGGIKMRVAQTGTDIGSSASGSYSSNTDQIGDYNCESWTADSSKFAIPTNITFKVMN